MSDHTRAADEFASADSAQAFAALGQLVLGKENLESILGRVAALAKGTIAGVADVSVTLINSEQPCTAAFTGRLARDLDERQFEHGYGPCLDAAHTGETVIVDDMATEPRWPDFTPAATMAWVRSSLSVGLTVQQRSIGALNLFSTNPGNFDADAAELARTFAGYAAVALANASLYASTAELAAQMGKAMESRAVIEQAKGVIMAQLRCDAATAFDAMVSRSQHTNRKLREIATDVITGATGAS
ncbi:MAG: GAF and ANTAR domain-containing protein [Trebonia sp.]